MPMKNSVIWRMIAWFILLALIPLGAVMIYVQRQVNQTILNIELQSALEKARLLAADSGNHPDALDHLAQVFGEGEEIAFILSTDGTYLTHSNPLKVGMSADQDYPFEILEALISGDQGSFEETGKLFGYATTPGQNAVAVIGKDNQPVTSTMESLSKSIFIQLSVILLITSIVSGVAILAVINPLRRLASFADQVGAGNLEAKIDQTNLEGEIAILAGSLTSMTARLRDLIATLETRVAERTRDLERADLMKSQFLASMSHELRTPLNSIINFTQLLTLGVYGPVTDDQMAILNTSLGSSKHLLQLINDVLDISKIQAGKLNLYIEENVNLHEEINAVVTMAEPLLDKQNSTIEQPLQFIQDIDGNLPLTACDRRRIRQVLLNLLSNAIRFTEQGSITLSAKKKGETFVFAVMDTGPGVPHEMQERIFEPFVQAAADRKTSQGTGLGLAISRSLVQAHGGELWVESQIGNGASFFFTLPHRPKTTQTGENE